MQQYLNRQSTAGRAHHAVQVHENAPPPVVYALRPKARVADSD